MPRFKRNLGAGSEHVQCMHESMKQREGIDAGKGTEGERSENLSIRNNQRKTSAFNTRTSASYYVNCKTKFNARTK